MKTAQRWEPTALSAGRELTPARPPVAAGGFLKPGLYSPSPGRPVQTPRHWRLVSKRRGVPSRAGMVGASCRLVDVTGGARSPVGCAPRTYRCKASASHRFSLWPDAGRNL
jgi:hypothetical protein